MVLSPWGREALPFPKAWPWKLSPLQPLQEGKKAPRNAAVSLFQG